MGMPPWPCNPCADLRQKHGRPGSSSLCARANTRRGVAADWPAVPTHKCAASLRWRNKRFLPALTLCSRKQESKTDMPNQNAPRGGCMRPDAAAEPPEALRLDGLLRRALIALGQAGEQDHACRLAAEAWSLLRHDLPREAERYTGLLHRLTVTKHPRGERNHVKP